MSLVVIVLGTIKKLLRPPPSFAIYPLFTIDSFQKNENKNFILVIFFTNESMNEKGIFFCACICDLD